MLKYRGIAFAIMAAQFWLAHWSVAQQEPAPGAEAARAKKLIEDLDDPDAQVRRQASLQLNSLGGDVLAVIEESAKKEDLNPELRARLRLALTYIRPRVVREREARARKAWEAKVLHDAYDKSGHTNAAWDGDAHRAIDLFFPLGPDPLHGPAEPRDAALAAFQAAVDKGCRDPLLLALRGITDGQDAGRSYHTPTGNMTRIIDDLQKENYPAAVKMRVVNGYLRTTNITAGDRALIPISLVTEVAKTSGLPAGELDALANEFYMAQHENHDQFQVLNPFVDAYQRAAPNSAGPRLLRARAKLDAAFTTINNIDHFVNPPLWKQVLPQLKEVETLLQEAWRLDPRDPHAPSLMVGVKMYESEDGGGEEAMELWFHRAMESDPDSYEACVAKLAYLSPAWHGSAGQMLGFGRECLATENWRAGLPLILVQAHNRLSEGAPDSRQYFERPEVWADIREVFTGAVLNFPNDVNLRCEYAKYAAKCGQWDAAHRQFEIIGDKPVLAVFGSQASYDYLRKKAKRLVAETPATRPATN